MIKIIVDKQELTLYNDTSFVMELNNPVFSTEAIEGDVVYNFDIPVAGNERVFGFAHLPYTLEQRAYDCLVFVDGVQLIHGSLIIQKTTRMKYSVAVVVNPLPEGWTEQSIRNNHDEEIVVVNNQRMYKEQWKAYLLSCFENDGDVKFGLIQNKKGYGDDATGYGFWNGEFKGFLINRVFFNYMQSGLNQIVGEHLFAPDSLEKGNVGNVYPTCLCPQIRLSAIIRNMLTNAQWNFIGGYFTDTVINNVYIQSHRALDGTLDRAVLAAFTVDEYFGENTAYENTPIDMYGYWIFDWDTVSNNSDYIDYITLEDQQYGSFYFEVLSTALNPIAIYVFYGIEDGNSSQPGPYKIMAYNDMHWNEAHIFDEETVDSPKGLVVLRWNCDPGHNGKFKLTMLDANGNPVSNSFARIEVQAPESVILDQPVEGVLPLLNLYASSYRINQMLPDLSNSEFLTKVRNTLGLSIFLDATTKTVELGFVKDLELAKSENLDNFVLGRETEMDFETTEGYGYTLKSDVDNDTEEFERTVPEAVNDYRSLPPARSNHNKICRIDSFGAWFLSKRIGDDTVIWRWIFDYLNLDTTPLFAAGSIPEKMLETANTTRQTDIVVPSNVETYDRYHKVKEFAGMIPDVDFEVEGSYVNSNKEVSDRIDLVYYQGFSDVRLDDNTQCVYANMVSHSRHFSLRATGDRSLGELYIRKWLDYLCSSRVITHKFMLPLNKVLEVMRLLRPQAMPPEEQTRFIMVNNVRILPKKISIQIDNSSDLYLCEIQGVRA